MHNDPALHVLVQGALATVVRELRLEGRPEATADVRAEMETPEGVSLGVTGHVRSQSEDSLHTLVAEAKARISADQMLTRCDARLDSMERGEERRSSGFLCLERATELLSEALRLPSTVAAYTLATNNAEAALNRSSLCLVTI
ncbi:MAG: hypothetical protein ACO1OB_14550 [Archangium sp.]